MKRHPSLSPLSRDHHHGLLLCRKIRQGLKKGIDEDRIRAYAHWFYSEHLQPHFRLEEEEVFTLLPPGHNMVKEALEQHAGLHALFDREATIPAPLGSLADALEDHIRFEERMLFPEIQDHADPGQLARAGEMIDDGPIPTGWEDQFWL